MFSSPVNICSSQDFLYQKSSFYLRIPSISCLNFPFNLIRLLVLNSPSCLVLLQGGPCDTPIPRVLLTTRQPAKYSWMSSNPTPHHRVLFFGTHDLTKIEQSFLCTGSSTQNTTCTITRQHDPILYNDHAGSTYE